MEMENCCYRVSVKALVLNETRDKFLTTKREAGMWELPGGGLEWGRDTHEELAREIWEEMGLRVTWVADRPSHFITAKSVLRPGLWMANVLYEATLEHLDFTPSDECIEIAFVNAADIGTMEVCSQIETLAQEFVADRKASR